MLTAQDLHERAVAHGNAGRHALAARTLTRAAERTEDPDLVARIAGTRAYLLAETGDPDQALALCREALAAPGLSRRTRALLVSQVGLVELRRGDLDAALEHLTAATGALADDPARLGRVLLNRGLAHLDHGQVLRAERDFGAAAEQLELAGEVVEEAKARHNQGYAALVRGDLVRALRLMERAREDLVGLSPVTLAVCDLDRAAVLTAAGETTEAVRLLTAVAHVFGTRRLRQAQADAELALAGALLGTDATAAGAVARRAARRYRARGNALGAARADACALTAEVLGGPGRADQGGAGPGRARPGRVEDLAARLDASSAELAARGLTAEVTALRLQRARLDLRTGRPADAAGRLRRLRVTTRAPVLVRVLAREVRAEVAAAQGAPRRVLAHAAAGLDELETWQAASGSVDLQSGLAVHGRVLVLEGIRAAVSTRDPARVLEWSERARGLASRVAALRPPSDPATAADLTELRRLRLLGTPGADPGGRRDAQQREAGLRDAVRRRAWEREGHGVVGTVPRLDDVVPALAATEADLVTYLWSGDRLTALVVSGRAHVVDLGPWAPVRGLLDGLLADLDAAGADLPGPLA
ncbi:hypothetical protein Q9R32_10395, partial [Actinotalea sp. AC32]|nr:hypothetical protein [Actinotalea sp. AC32]